MRPISSHVIDNRSYEARNSCNCRTGRPLITFLLAERGVLHKPVLYLSHYLKCNRQEYYDRLQSIRDDGDWEGWLGFFLRGVVEVSTEATDTTRRVLMLREQHRMDITAGLGRAAVYGRAGGRGVDDGERRLISRSFRRRETASMPSAARRGARGVAFALRLPYWRHRRWPP